MSTLLFLRLVALRHDRRAVTALEYGLIAAVVVIVGLAGFSLVGSELSDKFTGVSDALGS